MRVTIQPPLLLLLLYSALSSWAAEPKHEVYVIHHKPPMVSVVDVAAGRVSGTIPIEKNPTLAVADGQGRFLYVVHDGGTLVTKPKLGRISVIDLANRRVSRLLPAGMGVTGLTFSEDGSRLFAFGLGKVTGARTKLKPGDEATVTVVDTARQEVESSFRSNDLAESFVANRDGSRVFVFSHGTRFGSNGDAVIAGLTMGILIGKAMPKQVNQKVSIFGGSDPKPLAEISLDNHLESISLSRDQERIFLLGQPHSDKGKRVGDGTLQVVDARSGRLLRTEKVGQDPQRLIRVEGVEGFWMAGKDEMRFVSDAGEVSRSRIELNPRGSAVGEDDLDGYPGEAISLGAGRIATLITKRDGRMTNRLAIINLGQRKVERVVPVGRKSVRAGKIAGRIALAVALSAASASAASAVGSPSFLFFVPTFGGGHTERLATRADGRYFYALNSASNDVTVIQSSDGAVVDKIAVDSTQAMLWSPQGGGNNLVCVGARELEVIDMETNKTTGTHKIGKGSLMDLQVDAAGKNLYVLTSSSLEVWDGARVERVHVVDGMKRPLMLVRRAESLR